MGKRVFILCLSVISTFLYAQDLNNLYNKILQSNGLQRTKYIDQLSQFPHAKIIEKTNKHLKSTSVRNIEAAAEVSGFYPDKSYEKQLVKQLKKAKDYELIHSLIFAIGKNKYKKSEKFLCKYVSTPKLYKQYAKPAFYALIQINQNACKSIFIKHLRKEKNALPILEYVIKTKNKHYLKPLKKLFKKTKNSSLKYASALALLALNNATSLPYLKSYIKNDLETGFLQIKEYRNLEKLLPKKSKHMTELLLEALKSSDVEVKLYATMTLAKRKEFQKLSRQDIDFLESYANTKNPEYYMYYSEFKRYEIIHQPKTKEISNENETVTPF